MLPSSSKKSKRNKENLPSEIEVSSLIVQKQSDRSEKME